MTMKYDDNEIQTQDLNFILAIKKYINDYLLPNINKH